MKDPLLLIGGGAIAVGLFSKGSKTEAPDQEAHRPQPDWALLPIAMRQVLLKKYGQAGVDANGKPLPQTPLGEMERVAKFWRREAQPFEGVDDPGLGDREDLLPPFERRVAALKVLIFGRLERPDLVSAVLVPGVAVPPFDAAGDQIAINSEIRAFWDAVDRLAIGISARASFTPEGWSEFLALWGEALGEVGSSMAEWLAGVGVDVIAGFGKGIFAANPLLFIGLGLLVVRALRGGA